MFFLTEFVATPTMKFRINHSTKLLEFGAEIHLTFYEPFYDHLKRWGALSMKEFYVSS